MNKIFLLVFGIVFLVGCDNSDERFEEWLNGYERGYVDGYRKAYIQFEMGEDLSLNHDWEAIYKENMIK